MWVPIPKSHIKTGCGRSIPVYPYRWEADTGASLEAGGAASLVLTAVDCLL